MNARAAPAEIGALRGPEDASRDASDSSRCEEYKPPHGGGEDEREEKSCNVDAVTCRGMGQRGKNRDIANAGNIPVTPARSAYFGPTEATNGLDASNAVRA